MVTARATSEKRRTYAEQNQERGREKSGAQAQHSGYSGDMETLFAKIDAITDNEYKPMYGADEEGPNYINI